MARKFCKVFCFIDDFNVIIDLNVTSGIFTDKKN